MSAVPPPPRVPPVMTPTPAATVPTRTCPKCLMAVPAKAHVCAYCKKRLRTRPVVIGCLGIIGAFFLLSALAGALNDLMSASQKGPLADGAGAPVQENPAEVAHRAKARREALSKLLRDRDEVQEIDFYYDKNTAKWVNSRSEMFIYIGDKAGRDPWLRMKLQYVAREWIFARSFIIKADSQTFTITPASSFEVKRDNGEGKVWEWYERSVTASDYVMLKAVAGAKSVTLRYEGTQYRQDRKLSAKEQQRIATILATFELMGGKP